MGIEVYKLTTFYQNFREMSPRKIYVTKKKKNQKKKQQKLCLKKGGSQKRNLTKSRQINQVNQGNNINLVDFITQSFESENRYWSILNTP